MYLAWDYHICYTRNITDEEDCPILNGFYMSKSRMVNDRLRHCRYAADAQKPAVVAATYSDGKA
ncbi:hypothetical protein BSK56_32345 [Paenibacillus borealis]|uniref:Uncharacterized protein n=1 Tax=Paenibacillus borealis TaxID=160799 RepID=A0ABX3GSK1_PAEBO|nr:hypothetical protein BSK56_32345 [Paenibacillus borealis]